MGAILLPHLRSFYLWMKPPRCGRPCVRSDLPQNLVVMERRTYTDDELLLAAAASSCMTDFLDRLGVAVTPGRRRHLRLRLAQAGADLRHWDHSPRRWYSTEQLAEAVATSASFAGVLRHLGVPQAGGSQAYLARRIRKEGLDISHFTGQAHMAGKKGRRARPEDVLVVNPPGSNRVKTSTLRRIMIEAGVPQRCSCCGLGPQWQGKPLTLVIDHLNGDWLDNREANLRFLCPNCHAQTATWCRKKGP